MYQKIFAFILTGLLSLGAGAAWTVWTAAQGYGQGTGGQLDYLAREALPEDLPEIPGPPRSAKRTLYDTLRGNSRPSQPAASAADRTPARNLEAPRSSGKSLPLLPVRSAKPAPAATNAGNEARASSSSSSSSSSASRLERVAEPVPQPVAAKQSAAAKKPEPTASAGDVKPAGDGAAKPKTTAKTTAKTATKSKANQTAQPERKAARKQTGPGSKRTAGKYDPQIAPTPRGEFRYYAPQYYRGIYLNSGVVRSKKRYEKLLEQSRKHKINTLVVDVQPRFPSKDFIRTARESGFYLVARVVVFEGGLKQPTIPEKHLSKVLDVAEQAARSGFMEIQLDYIRFADRARIGNLGLKQRYKVIAGILKRATDRLRPLGVRVGADIFGRIPFNRNDRIGQRMEVFAEHLDTLYPMLYPSHFYGDPSYIKDPYKTIYQGQKRSIDRVGDKIRTIAYIQGFKMKIGPSGLSYHNYIRKQLDASADSGGAGFIVWNARSRYAPFFKALADHDRRRSR